MTAPIIRAVDTRDLDVAKRWVEATRESVAVYKLGLEFFLTFGSEGVEKIKREFGVDIFLDLKLHDIPHTVAGAASAIINKLHMSCVAGHQQGKQIAYGKRADGKPICAIIVGSYYLHDESYMDQLSNRHWRGLLMMNEVNDGHFDEMFLSVEYLGRKYG